MPLVLEKVLKHWQACYKKVNYNMKKDYRRIFNNTIDAFLDLFKGANIGKAIIKVSEIE
jgi:NADPH-dependent curcumin reductase CurA